MSDATPVRRGRGRRPAAEVRADVLGAGARILLEEGLASLTFERVAKESGASRTTLHKWWPSPGALAAEAYFAHSRPQLEFPHTDSLFRDLCAQLGAFVGLLSDERTGRAVAELIGAAQIDPGVGAAWSEGYALPRRQLARDRLEAARESGELRRDADIDILVDQLWGAGYHRLLVLRTPVSELDVERLVGQVLRGAAVSVREDGSDAAERRAAPDRRTP